MSDDYTFGFYMFGEEIFGDDMDVRNTASGNITLPQITFSIVAPVSRSGSGAIDLPVMEASLRGGIKHSGEGAITLSVMEASSSGGLQYDGSGAIELTAVSMDASACIRKYAIGDIELPSFSGEAHGATVWDMSNDVFLPAFEASGAGSRVASATGSLFFSVFETSAEGTKKGYISAVGDFTLPVMAVGQSSVELFTVVNSSGSVTLPAMTAGGATALFTVHTGSGALELPAFEVASVTERKVFQTASGACSLPVFGSVSGDSHGVHGVVLPAQSIDLPAVSCLGQGTRHILATVTTQLTPFLAEGTLSRSFTVTGAVELPAIESDLAGENWNWFAVSEMLLPSVSVEGVGSRVIPSNSALEISAPTMETTTVRGVIGSGGITLPLAELRVLIPYDILDGKQVYRVVSIDYYPQLGQKVLLAEALSRRTYEYTE